jgi:hypothetical protein
MVDFGCARFSGGTVRFTDVQFSGSDVDFSLAEFSGGAVYFTGTKLSGGTLHFTDPGDWSCPPKFPWADTPPPGVKLPPSSRSY